MLASCKVASSYASKGVITMARYEIIDGLLALPDGLQVGGSLYLSGCTGLTALPDGLSKQIRGTIYK